MGRIKKNGDRITEKCLSISIMCLCILASCASEKPLSVLAEKNHKYTERHTMKLAKKNGNAVAFMSSMANFSYILSYGDYCLDIQKITILPKGEKVIHEQTIPYSFGEHHLFCQDSILSAEQEYYKKHDRIMDGDYLLCRYKQDGQWRRDVLPLQFKILKQGDFQSTFLRQISDDMKAYKIWEPFINK